MRADRGFNKTYTEPVLVCEPPPPLPAPVYPATLCTAGSAWTMFINWTSLSFISWNEMLWSATIPPVIRPVSSCGKKPLGITVNKSTLSNIVINNPTITSRPCSSDQASVRP